VLQANIVKHLEVRELTIQSQHRRVTSQNKLKALTTRISVLRVIYVLQVRSDHTSRGAPMATKVLVTEQILDSRVLAPSAKLDTTASMGRKFSVPPDSTVTLV